MRVLTRTHILQVIRFGVVGCGAALTFIAVHALMVGPLGTGEKLGAFVAFCTSIAASYLGQSLFTFRVPPNRAELARFILASIGLSILGSFATDYLVNTLGAPSNLAALIVAGTYPLFSFPLQKFWVFRRRDPDRA